MKKKNILTATVSLSLVACLSIGATLAYFTDKTETKTNVFTTGHVEIGLSDFGGEGTNDEPGLVYGTKNNQGGYTYNDFMPGDTLKKEVSVVGMPDTQNAWVAVRVKYTGLTQSEMQESLVKALQDAGQTSNWSILHDNGDFVMVAKTPIKAGQSKTLFNTIDIPAGWKNDKADFDFTISVEAYAAQENNLTYDEFLEMAKAGASSFEDYNA